VETNATRMCALLVGLPDVNVLAVDDQAGAPLRVHVETVEVVTGCAGCGTRAWVKDRPEVVLTDLPAFGRPAVLVWHKRRWCCPDLDCDTKTWTEHAPKVAAARAGMTDRAGRWVTVQVGRAGRTVAEVARELGADWHTIMDAVTAYGAPLVADPARIGEVTALGLDETLFVRRGQWRTQAWCTSIVDVNRPAQLLDVVEGRDSKAPSAWLNTRPQSWRDAIRWGVMDLSGPYRKVFTDTLPSAAQVADPFHVVKLANERVDECRRRVQNETLGHRGRKNDPLYRGRRLLTKGHERLDERGNEKLMGLLEAGDPHGEVRMTWHAKETLRGFYAIDDPADAEVFLDELIDNMTDASMPTEVRSLAGTLRRWRAQVLAWHQARVSNGPTEATNNLIKRIKRVGFGFRKFASYRIRVLLYAGQPNWDLLAAVTPR
jgi:transposase